MGMDAGLSLTNTYTAFLTLSVYAARFLLTKTVKFSKHRDQNHRVNIFDSGTSQTFSCLDKPLHGSALVSLQYTEYS